MANYKKMYLQLFNSLTDAVDQMEQANYGMAMEILRQAQAAGEEIYLEDGPEEEIPS